MIQCTWWLAGWLLQPREREPQGRNILFNTSEMHRIYKLAVSNAAEHFRLAMPSVLQNLHAYPLCICICVSNNLPYTPTPQTHPP